MFLSSKIFKQAGLLSVALLFALGLQYVHAWTGPTAAPPNNNIAEPVNVGSSAQIKDGGLGILGNLYTYQRLGIGTNRSNPQYSLDLGTDSMSSSAQGIRFADGTVQTTASGGAQSISFAKFLQVREVYAAGTNGPTIASGAFVARVLNTVVTNTISGASVSSNRITLPAGTYYIDADAPLFSAQMQRNVLFNVTDGTYTVLGLNAKPNGGGSNQGTDGSRVTGMFTITAQKQFELRSRVAESAYGYTVANWGVSEVYTDVKIWKLD